MNELYRFLLPNGSRINILNAVCTSYREIGEHLLDRDSYRSTVGQHYNLRDSATEIVAIFSMWIEGKGLPPVTWQTLVSVLEECDYETLADTIRGESLI